MNSIIASAIGFFTLHLTVGKLIVKTGEKVALFIRKIVCTLLFPLTFSLTVVMKLLSKLWQKARDKLKFIHEFNLKSRQKLYLLTKSTKGQLKRKIKHKFTPKMRKKKNNAEIMDKKQEF